MIASGFYIKNVIYPEIYNKFRDIPILDSIKLRVYLPDVAESDDTAILDCFYLLSFITKNQPFCSKLRKKVDKRHFAVSFEFFVNIKEDLMYNFLDYFILCRLNYLKRTRGDISREVLFMLRNYLFVVEDVRFWLDLPEEFKGFKWPITVELCFNSPAENSTAIFYFLSALKLPTIDKRAFFRSKDDVLSEKKNAQL